MSFSSKLSLDKRRKRTIRDIVVVTRRFECGKQNRSLFLSHVCVTGINCIYIHWMEVFTSVTYDFYFTQERSLRSRRASILRSARETLLANFSPQSQSPLILMHPSSDAYILLAKSVSDKIYFPLRRVSAVA